MSTNDYFSVVQTSESSYRESPSESLSVSRLLQNKAYWKNPFASFVKKKKKLIINDTSIAEWDKNQCIIVAERLSALQEEGFEIYIPCNNELVVFNTVMLKKPTGLMSTPFLLDESLAQKAVQKLKVSRDEILILNQEKIAALVAEEDDWKKLPSRTHIKCYRAFSASSLKELFSNAADEIESLDLSLSIRLNGLTLAPLTQIASIKITHSSKVYGY